MSFVSYLLAQRRDSDDELVEASTTTHQVNLASLHDYIMHVSLERQTEFCPKHNNDDVITTLYKFCQFTCL